MFDLFIRLFCMGCILVVKPDNSIQLFLAVLTAFTFFFILVDVLPYERKLDNRLSMFSWGLFIITIIVGFALRSDIERKVYAHETLSIILVFAHTLFFLVAAFCSFVLPFKRLKVGRKITCLRKISNFCCKCDDQDSHGGPRPVQITLQILRPSDSNSA